MQGMNLSQLVKDKVAQFTGQPSEEGVQFPGSTSVGRGFPDGSWCPGHRNRPLRMIAYDDMAPAD